MTNPNPIQKPTNLIRLTQGDGSPIVVNTTLVSRFAPAAVGLVGTNLIFTNGDLVYVREDYFDVWAKMLDPSQGA